MQDIRQVLNILPHRYPFLMVDRIIKYDSKQISAFKNVTINEPMFQGHFPNDPIFPGVLIVEGLAQTAGLLMLQKETDLDSKLLLFTSMDKVKFRLPVYPGDQLVYQVEVIKQQGQSLFFQGKAFVEDKIACEGMFSAFLISKEQFYQNKLN